MEAASGVITIHQEPTGYCVIAHIGDPGPAGAMEALNAIPWLRFPSYIGGAVHFRVISDGGVVTLNERTYCLYDRSDAREAAGAIHDIVQAAVVPETS
jgi:hypothetical protein